MNAQVIVGRLLEDEEDIDPKEYTLSRLGDKWSSRFWSRLWKDEFGRGYAVPPEVLSHPGIIDTSWHNDVSPSFTLKKYERDGEYASVVLWVEHPDRRKREQDYHRFMVLWMDDGTVLYDGDDVHAALAALERGLA